MIVSAGHPSELAQTVRERLTRRARDPEQILAERRLFYLRHGGGGEHGYGQSELAFIAWLLRRGTLGQRRSRWWSGVNFDLAFHSELAAALVEHCMADRHDVPAAVRPWLTFFARPCALSWYRAHNASIVRSYLARAHEARSEPLLEQRFMGRLLIRVLCVQAVLELGEKLPRLARYADPRGDMVARVLGLRLLYPAVYPLSPDNLDGLAQAGMHLLETTLWRAGLEPLFHAAAEWLELPALCSLVRDGRLHYPDVAHELSTLPHFSMVPA